MQRNNISAVYTFHTLCSILFLLRSFLLVPLGSSRFLSSPDNREQGEKKIGKAPQSLRSASQSKLRIEVIPGARVVHGVADSEPGL